jgi:hypothetical protein
MKEKMQEWISTGWLNLDSNSAKSLVNRVVAVIEKKNTTTKGALTGLAQSINALANDAKTPENSVLELWFISEFIMNILVPIADSMDAQVKANTTKQKPVWADSQAEAKAIAEAQKPAKPTRAPRGAQAPAVALDSDVLKALATLKGAGLI